MKNYIIAGAVGLVLVIVGYFVFKKMNESSTTQSALLASILNRNDNAGTTKPPIIVSQSEPTAQQWITSIAGVAQQSGLFDWTRKLFGGGSSENGGVNLPQNVA